MRELIASDGIDASEILLVDAIGKEPKRSRSIQIGQWSWLNEQKAFQDWISKEFKLN